MSKIINKFSINSLQKKYLYKLLIFMAFFIAALIFALYSVYKDYYLTTFIIVALLIYISKKTYENLIVLNAGLRGEKKSLQILKDLPMNCSVISDIKIKFNNKSAQIDHIIISDTDIWVLEVKNISGILTGDKDDKKLCQTKHNTGEIKTPYNPIYQVSNHRDVLENILSRQGFYININCGVYFANKNLTNKIDWGKENIFFYGEESKMLNKLSGRKKGKEIDKKAIIKAVKKVKIT